MFSFKLISETAWKEGASTKYEQSILDSEKMIAAQLRENDSVATSTIEELYGKGSAKDITDAGLITAYYYQSLKSEQVKGEMDSFTIFVTAEKEKELEIEKITKKNQKKK